MMSKAKDGRQLLLKRLCVLTELPSRYLKSQNNEMNQERYNIPRRAVSSDTRTVLQQSRSCPLQAIHCRIVRLKWAIEGPRSYCRSVIKPWPLPSTKSSITSPDARDIWAIARAVITFFFAGGIARLSKEDGFQTMALISSTTNSTFYISMNPI